MHLLVIFLASIAIHVSFQYFIYKLIVLSLFIKNKYTSTYSRISVTLIELELQQTLSLINQRKITQSCCTCTALLGNKIIVKL